MQSNFDIWYRRAVVYELGNDDDKRDPGGRTSDGITQREYDLYRDHKGKPRRDVWAIGTGCKANDPEALAERRELFKGYWDRIRGDDLPSGIDYVVADGALNSGPAQSVKWLQRALGVSVVDGEIGPATMAAIKEAVDDDAIVDDMCARRLAFMHSLRTWDHFGKGWAARVANVKKVGEALATGSVPGDPVLLRELGGAAKAKAADIKQPVIPVTATHVATAAGAASTGISTTVAALQTSVNSLSDQVHALPMFGYIAAALGIATAAGTVLGLVATLAKSAADAANAGTASIQVDPDADSIATPVAVNDNTPPASGGKVAA